MPEASHSGLRGRGSNERGMGLRGRSTLHGSLNSDKMERPDSNANGFSSNWGAAGFDTVESSAGDRGHGTGLRGRSNNGTLRGSFNSKNVEQHDNGGADTNWGAAGFDTVESTTGDRSFGFRGRGERGRGDRGRGDRGSRGDRGGRGFRGAESRGSRGGRGQFHSNFGNDEPRRFDSANANNDLGQSNQENGTSEDREHARNNFSDRAKTNEPLKKFVAEYRNVDAIFQEDEEHKQEYANIVDDDEDITVTPLDESVGILDTWKDAAIEEKLLENIYRAGYVRPRKIQAFSIPYICQAKDVMGHAETGSGKTIAYLVPIVDYIWKKKVEHFENKEAPAEEYPEPYAIVILPTRELAVQIRDQALKLAVGSLIKVQLAYGGIGYREITRNLNKGCDILIATPGMLRTLVQNGNFGLSHIKFVVLDEADRLLMNEGNDTSDMAFAKVLEYVLNAPTFPPKDQRVNLMFSATYTEEVQNLAKKLFMRSDMVLVSNNKFQGSNHRIQQNIIQVSQQSKFDKLVDLLNEERESAKKINPDNPKVRPIIIFVDTKDRTKQLSLYFTGKGISSTFINGDMSQDLRERALKEFREQTHSLLIATDVLARGIDLKDLDHVINCDLTNEITTYIHRIGRTGRLREGTATTFFDPNNRRDVGLANKLVELITDSGAEPPQFLLKAANIPVRTRTVSSSSAKSTIDSSGTAESTTSKSTKSEASSSAKSVSVSTDSTSEYSSDDDSE